MIEGMSIEGAAGRGAVAPAGRAGRRAGGAAFHVESDDAAPASELASHGAVAAAPPIATRGMLALQEDLADSVADRRARRRGRDLLAALARLQIDLLGGGTGPDRLRDLAELLENVPVADHRELGEAIGAVALRARIELWRHGGGGPDAS